jgi:hypothetical protein
MERRLLHRCPRAFVRLHCLNVRLTPRQPLRALPSQHFDVGSGSSAGASASGRVVRGRLSRLSQRAAIVGSIQIMIIHRGGGWIEALRERGRAVLFVGILKPRAHEIEGVGGRTHGKCGWYRSSGSRGVVSSGRRRNMRGIAESNNSHARGC